MLVVGDICLDRWCWYDPGAALSPRPRPAFRGSRVVATEVTPGRRRARSPTIWPRSAQRRRAYSAWSGDDGFGCELRRALSARGISPDLLIASPDFCTFTYTKLINCRTGEEDLPRVDFVNTSDLPPSRSRGVLSALPTQWPIFDVVIVSDQAETEHGGVVTRTVRGADLLDAGGGRPGKGGLGGFPHARRNCFRSVVLKPNQHEAEDGLPRRFGRRFRRASQRSAA